MIDTPARSERKEYLAGKAEYVCRESERLEDVLDLMQAELEINPSPGLFIALLKAQERLDVYNKIIALGKSEIPHGSTNERVADWIVMTLETNGGECLYPDLKEAAKASGFTNNQLKNAKKRKKTYPLIKHRRLPEKCARTVWYLDYGETDTEETTH